MRVSFALDVRGRATAARSRRRFCPPSALAQARAMKSVCELVIDVPQPRLAALFSDPVRSTEWMHDVDHVEPIVGDMGQPGSMYLLVPKRGNRGFVATVVERNPDELRLALERRDVSVEIADHFVPLSEHRTKLVSEETFEFKGWLAKLIGFFTRGAIRRAHRTHMHAFKRFAERT
jgi:hypothetical protein